jgi:hypothetical protein
MEKLPNIPKKALQGLYEQCCWSGYAMYEGVKVHQYAIERIARQKGVMLQYFCPA